VRHCSPTRRGEHAGLTSWSIGASTPEGGVADRLAPRGV